MATKNVYEVTVRNASNGVTTTRKYVAVNGRRYLSNCGRLFQSKQANMVEVTRRRVGCKAVTVLMRMDENRPRDEWKWSHGRR